MLDRILFNATREGNAQEAFVMLLQVYHRNTDFVDDMNSGFDVYNFFVFVVFILKAFSLFDFNSPERSIPEPENSAILLAIFSQN